MSVTKQACVVCPFCGCTDTYCTHGTTRECYDCGSLFFEGDQNSEPLDAPSYTINPAIS